MTDITLEQAKKVSLLSRIKFSDAELEQITYSLNGVLHWVEKIQDVNTDNVEALVNPNDNKLVLLADDAANENLQEDVLKNAPKAKYGYFVVPKVIE